MRRAMTLVAALGLGSCGPEAGVPEAGQVVATWRGLEQGGDRMDAQATLCARDSTLELLASRGDRGVGLAIHLASAEPAPGRFPILNPNLESLPRPAATAAYRYLAPESLRGFVSRDGDLDLVEVGPNGLSGRFTLRLVALSGADTLLMEGSFRSVPVGPAPTPCGQAPRAPVEVP